MAVLAGALVALAGCGAGDDPVTPATPVGLTCQGTGPTVVLVSGLGVPSAEAWGGLMPRLKGLRACAWERPGLGGRAPGPPPRDAAHIAGELARVLDAVDGRVILVGASFGGLIVQLYASRHPGRTAGVVLVDSLHPDLDRAIVPVIGRAAARRRERMLAANSEGVSFRDLLRSDAQVRRARSFPRVPLVVLVHGISFDEGGRPFPPLERLWRRLQRELAARSPRGRMIIATHSHHRIAQDQPALVARAIRSVAG